MVSNTNTTPNQISENGDKFTHIEMPDSEVLTQTQIIFSKRTGLTKADFVEFSEERIQQVVINFKQNVLSADQSSLKKIDTAGRTILYRQIQEVYKIGCAIRKSLESQAQFKAVLSGNGLHRLVPKLRTKNFWHALVTLLYGDVHEEATEDGTKVVCTPNISAAKYANVLRFLEESKVNRDKVVEFIQAFNDQEFGGGIHGMELRDRKRNPGPTPKPASVPRDLSYSQQRRRDKLIARGEDESLNTDVFAAAKAPSTLRYGQAVYKVVGEEMVIVGYTEWGRGKYENYVINRARKVLRQEEELQAKEDARQAALNADALKVITSDGTQDQVAALIQAGVPKDTVQLAISNAIAAIPVPADFNDFASPDPV